jgi:uncharacterized membrane protein HdeD (DUF308 family)
MAGIAVTGIMLFTVGAIFALSYLTSQSVNPLLLSGILLIFAGIFYFIVGIVLIKLAAGLIHSALTKNLEKVIKKLN